MLPNSKAAAEPAAKEVPVVCDGKSVEAQVIPSIASVLKPLGALPMLGRDFVEGDFEPGAVGVAIISYEFWKGAYASKPDVIGRQCRIDEKMFTVIAIVPASHAELKGKKVWVAQAKK